MKQLQKETLKGKESKNTDSMSCPRCCESYFTQEMHHDATPPRPSHIQSCSPLPPFPPTSYPPSLPPSSNHHQDLEPLLGLFFRWTLDPFPFAATRRSPR